MTSALASVTARWKMLMVVAPVSARYIGRSVSLDAVAAMLQRASKRGGDGGTRRQMPRHGRFSLPPGCDRRPNQSRQDRSGSLPKRVSVQENQPYDLRERDVGIASGRTPEVYRDESIGSIRLTFRGTSDARSSVDRDTRIRIAISSTQAAHLWYALGERLTDMEKRQSNPGGDRSANSTG
jgi:hypothetical protein